MTFHHSAKQFLVKKRKISHLEVFFRGHSLHILPYASSATAGDVNVEKNISDGEFFLSKIYLNKRLKYPDSKMIPKIFKKQKIKCQKRIRVCQVSRNDDISYQTLCNVDKTHYHLLAESLRL